MGQSMFFVYNYPVLILRFSVLTICLSFVVFFIANIWLSGQDAVNASLPPVTSSKRNKRIEVRTDAKNTPDVIRLSRLGG